MMFGRKKYPRLSVADQLIIDERRRAQDLWLRFYKLAQMYDYPADKRAYAIAASEAARARMDAADAAYDAMMERLKAEARAAIAKATGAE